MIWHQAMACNFLSFKLTHRRRSQHVYSVHCTMYFTLYILHIYIFWCILYSILFRMLHAFYSVYSTFIYVCIACALRQLFFSTPFSYQFFFHSFLLWGDFARENFCFFLDNTTSIVHMSGIFLHFEWVDFECESMYWNVYEQIVRLKG